MRDIAFWRAVHRRPRLVCVLRALSLLGEAVAVLALASVTVQLLYTHHTLRAMVLLLVLGCGFAAVSLWRRSINAQRPYELHAFGMTRPHRTGCSFPSRHAFCAFAIGVAAFACHGVVAAVVLLCAVLQGAARYLLGVHFARDLLVGALLGVGCGALSLLCLLV